MSLKDIAFSDIILFSQSDMALPSLLKGVAGYGQKLILPPQNCADEVKELLDAVSKRYQEAHYDLNRAFRLEFNGSLYRTAIFEDIKGGHTFFLRRMADAVPSFKGLGFPRVLEDWLLGLKQCKGLLLVTGSQGSGKTTTAAALIKARLECFGGHAISFENPVEMPLAGPVGKNGGYCFQTEVPHEEELEAHIERAHRYSFPNIIYIGEIRSKYAAAVALQVALGSNQQLVVATIHGKSIIDALTRLLNWAREKDGAIANQNLAQTLLSVLRQELITGEGQKREMELADSLLLPFDADGEDNNITGIRNKIQEDKLLSLNNDINFQFQRMRSGII